MYVWAFLAILLIIFVVQNSVNGTAVVWFLGWSWTLSTILVILPSVVLGVIIGYLIPRGQRGARPGSKEPRRP